MKSRKPAIPQPRQATRQSTAATQTDPLPLSERQQLVALFNAGRQDELESRTLFLLGKHPKSGFAWKCLGAALQIQGKDGLPAMQKAAELLPGDVEAQSNLAAVLKDLGRRDEAVSSYRRVLALQSDHVDAHNQLGITLFELGRYEEATASYRRAVQLKPDYATVHSNLGNALNELGRLDEAVASFRRALELQPDLAVAHSNLGNALRNLGRLDEAVASYRRALEINPDIAATHSNLGTALNELGRWKEAAACYQRALKLQPSYAEAYSNLGRTLIDLGQHDDAIASCLRALELQPNLVVAHSNLGNALRNLGRLDEAVASYRRALEINPDIAATHSNMGVALNDLGRQFEAVECFRRALEIKPDYAEAHSNLIFNFNHMQHLPAAQVYAEHRLWAEQQTVHCLPLAHDCDERDPQRRLRVGYVSPDLRLHSVAFFFEPLLREHDRQTVEVFCYAEVAEPDAVTLRLQGLADHWLMTVGMTNEALAQRIIDDRIDILVDLAGHTGRNRLLVFARKPAPVQVTWLGYPHSTGLDAIGYRLVDALTDPPGIADAWASETLVRLAGGFLCYSPPADAPVVVVPPSLENGLVTFGSFNNPTKLSPVTLDAWAELLLRVPGSRLLLKGKRFADTANGSAFLAQLEQRSIAPERVILLGQFASMAEHLAIYEQVDIALDPFPYNGTTTTCEALWMGVPVVSLCGDRHAGRVGASLLTQLGLVELVADSVDTYVSIAAGLAGDLGRLSAMRSSQRARMAVSDLCNAPAFARKIEVAYRDMWQLHCASVDPS